MPDGPVLLIVELSDSFRSAWPDLAEEAGAQLVTARAADDLPGGGAAVLVAAGGEEEQALDLLPQLTAATDVPIFVVGARPSHRFAVEAMRRGAGDYFALPGDVDLLRRTVTSRVDAGRERHRRSGEIAASGANPFVELVGESTALLDTIAQAQRIMPHRDVTVLIGGETGTGKELLARALHHGGPRAGGPFVGVNCAAIPAQLLESELFGHERGAFTDAHRAKPGLFEEADGGTLFLDEVGHLPLPLQGKLLRALDQHEIRRVGANTSRTVDVRIIAASLVNLRQAVDAGEFREDLFYRLNVVQLTLPPLRDRGDDVTLLAETFTRSLAGRYGVPVPKIGTRAAEALRRHSWPGNVRELRHAVERALLLSEPGTLDADQLAPSPVARQGSDNPLPFPARLDVIEVAAAQAAVTLNDGNKSAAARQLGISRSRLQRLLDDEANHART